MLNPRANQYTGLAGPACGTKKCFIAAAAAGNITTTVNKGRWAGPISSPLLLDVYGRTFKVIFPRQTELDLHK